VGIIALRGGALPAGAARHRARGLGAGDIGEGIGMFGPLRPPQRRAARQRRFLLDVRIGQFGDEARSGSSWSTGRRCAVGGVEDRAAPPRAGDRDIGEAAFFLEAGEAAFVHRALRGEHAFLPAGQEHVVEFQPLGGVDGHDRDLFASSAASLSITRLTCSRKSPSVSYSSIARASSARFSSRPADSALRSACSAAV
jgi:hypothetical protein